jgi:hypothetical protein
MRAASRAPTFKGSKADRKGEAVDEMYRILGREHQADLEREAQSRRLAAAARAPRPDPVKAPSKRRRGTWIEWIPSRVAAFLR